MINYKERVVAELIFKQQVHSLLVTRIEDNVIEVRCSGRIFDAKGNGFTFTTLTAKNKIENLGAYIYTYLTRTLKWNKNLMVIRVDGQSYNFHQLHKIRNNRKLCPRKRAVNKRASLSINNWLSSLLLLNLFYAFHKLIIDSESNLGILRMFPIRSVALGVASLGMSK